MRARSSFLASALSAAPKSMASNTFPNTARRQARLVSSLQSSCQQHPTKRESNDGPLLSRVSGPTDKPLCELSLSQFWEEAVSKYADLPALISKHEPASQHGKRGSSSDDCVRWTYGAMNEHIKSLVAGLHQLGIRKADRVAVLMMNCSAYGALQWACAEVGAILVTLNPAYSTSELRRALNLVEATTLFVVPSLRGTNYLESLLKLLPSLSSSASASGDPTVLQDETLSCLKRIVVIDNLDNRPRYWESNSVLAQQRKSFSDAMSVLNGRALDYRDLLVSSPSTLEQDEVLNTDVINLQLTSGTTGQPKAVALTSRNLLNNGIAIGDNLRFTEADKLCNIPPLFHCFGLVLGNLAAWTHGASVVYAAEGFDPLRALRAVSEERCTAMHGVPTHFIAELELLDSAREHAEDPSRFPLPKGMLEGETFDFSSLRTGLTSGSTVPIALMEALVSPGKLGLRDQTVVYGMTETSPVTFGCDVDAPIVRRCETVGRVYPHVHAKIVSPDDSTGKPLPVGQPGELCTAGYVVMEGYWKDPRRTNEAMERHPDEPDIVWMRTGDIGIMDQEGYVRIVGRSKDVIIRGGENLFPPNIENCIDRMEGVATNAVIAVPDEKYGEAVGVFVARSHAEAHVTPAEIRAYVKKHVGGQSAPAWVWFLGEDGVAAEFPKTASGKIQKPTLLHAANLDLIVPNLASGLVEHPFPPYFHPPRSSSVIGRKIWLRIIRARSTRFRNLRPVRDPAACTTTCLYPSIKLSSSPQTYAQHTSSSCYLCLSLSGQLFQREPSVSLLIRVDKTLTTFSKLQSRRLLTSELSRPCMPGYRHPLHSESIHLTSRCLSDLVIAALQCPFEPSTSVHERPCSLRHVPHLLGVLRLRFNPRTFDALRPPSVLTVQGRRRHLSRHGTTPALSLPEH